MDEELKILAYNIVKRIDRNIRSVIKHEPFKIGKTIDIGADGTPTKYIDKIAEDAAIKTLKKSPTAVNLLSEEAGFIDQGGDYLMVLDPVDGTRNAIRGLPYFSVSLALGKKKLSDIEYGIVKNIANRDEFIVEHNHGTFFNKNPVVIPDVPANELLFNLAFSKRFDPLIKMLSSRYAVRSLGCTSLEMCMVATGALDAYIVCDEYMRVTDIAASTLFVREAGGMVTDITGKKLRMDLTLETRTSVIAAGNTGVVQSIAEFRKIG
jgi:fructose-1,6-bisphosphatase/inositol monophosphatase family enzyme